MAYDGETFLPGDRTILLERFADYVRPYPAKVLAKTIGCTEATAENFRKGVSWPNAAHWLGIVRAFGRDVLACVFEPEINDTLARLSREQRQLEERLEEIRKRRRQAVGGLDFTEERASPSPDRETVAARALTEREHTT